MPCVAEVVNRSLKADCTDFKMLSVMMSHLNSLNYFSLGTLKVKRQVSIRLSDSISK